MTDYQLDRILRAAKRLASAARFEGIALTGKTSDDYRHRQAVTEAAWTALRAAVDPSSDGRPDTQPFPSGATQPSSGHRPQNLPSPRLEAYACLQ
jgi:hypothetical protein